MRSGWETNKLTEFLISIRSLLLESMRWARHRTLSSSDIGGMGPNTRIYMVIQIETNQHNIDWLGNYIYSEIPP